MNERVAKLTAKWWRKKLECCHHDNGDTSSSSSFACFMADMLAQKHAPTKSQLDIFENELTRLIMESKMFNVYLRCDYNPCQMLSDAAEVANINPCCFPFKTNTSTIEDRVEVSDGYCAKWVEISESDLAQ